MVQITEVLKKAKSNSLMHRILLTQLYQKDGGYIIHEK
jgi:hypothetical protein